MAVINEPVAFTLKVKGDVTGADFFGTFKAKPFLSHREQMLKDRLRREYLGQDGTNASPRAQNQAFVLSEVQVRLVDAPSWWRDASNGSELIDDSVVAEIFNQCMKIEKEAFESVHKKAEENKKELEKIAENKGSE